MPPLGRERRARVRRSKADGGPGEAPVDTESMEDAATLVPAGPKPVLTHPPRPRKKKRR